MKINEQDIDALFRKWLVDATTAEEEQLLLEVIEHEEAERLLGPAVKGYWEELKLTELGATGSGVPQFSERAHNRARFILDKYPAESFPEFIEGFGEDELQPQSLVAIADLPAEETSPGEPVHRIPFLKTAWFKYAAAILIIVGIGSYLWNSGKKAEESLANSKQLQTDVSPGGEKAVLTLADGTKIILDEAVNGQLANQGGVQVIKLTNGQIAYDLRGLTADSKEVMWNTMSTPKGGQYQVTLPDGTKVWLNAYSSITFPTAFVASKREVKITGEIYFEVAKDKKRPFVVDVDGRANVKVLGTSFNVNSYQDEGSIKTTLIDGSVAVAVSSDRQGNTGDRLSRQSNTSAVDGVVLKPGQQAISSSSNRQLQIKEGNIAQTLAWKNGIFDFTGADLKTVMRQLERWYDIKVQYKGSISNITFEGRMYRNVNLSDVLEVLQEMGVKFKLDGKNLIVL